MGPFIIGKIYPMLLQMCSMMMVYECVHIDLNGFIELQSHLASNVKATSVRSINLDVGKRTKPCYDKLDCKQME